MRQYQHGVATLLITSILLSVALVVTLGSYKNLFYQIKRAQNEVKARQQHWEAEGGLECVFSYVNNDVSKIARIISANHSNLDSLCKDTLNLSQLNVTDLTAGVYRINSISHNSWTQLNKTFSTQNNSGRGAIQTTSRLTTYGDLKIHPDVKGGINVDKKYECVSMTYKYSYTILGSPTAKYQTGTVRENSLYPSSPSGSCTSNTTTIISLSNYDSKTKTDDPKNSDSELKDDFVHDSNVDPFQSFLGMRKTPENISKVKSSFPEAGRVVVSDAVTCKSAIENAYKLVDKVWITGNCAIHGNLALQGSHEKYTLVIQDGIFINTGSTTFQGSIFHLVDKNQPQFHPDNLKDYWNSLFATPAGGTTNFTIGKQYTDLTQTVYVDAGAFHATGGYGFDTDGLKTSIAGSMELLFDSVKDPQQDGIMCVGGKEVGMCSKQCGFSLIEVMISFVLIGVGALGLVKLQAYIEQRADYAVYSIEALNLAEQKLEWFRTRGASSALPSANFDTSIVSGNDTSHPFYTLSWSVPAATLSGALKTIHIEAAWQDRHGETQSVELRTMISKYSEFD